MDAAPCHESDFACNLVWDATGNATASRAAEYLIGRPTTILAIVIGALVCRWLVHRLIDKIVRRAERGGLAEELQSTLDSSRIGSIRLGSTSLADAVTRTGDANERRVSRARTLGSLLKSISTGVLVTVAALMILSELNLDITPLLASAGIAGVALGFGAQSLVKDFLSGLFVIFEDQYGVGDTVDLGEATGVVEAVSMRVTRLRDASGTVWYVRNGEIMRVANQSQNWSRAMVDIPIDPQADLTKARQVLEAVAESLWGDEEINGVLVEAPEVVGVESITVHAASLRVHIKTTPNEQLRLSRIFRERATSQLATAGIALAQAAPGQAPSTR
jgi:small conductance mechanosensitive channel